MQERDGSGGLLRMKQLGLGFNLSTKKTRKREFLEEMEHVVPWGPSAGRRPELPEGQDRSPTVPRGALQQSGLKA